MFRDKINLLKKIKENNPNKRKLENMILLLIILIIVTVAINIIFAEDKKIEEEVNTNKQLAEQDIYEVVSQVDTKKELESQLENILSKIAGVGDVTVFVNYSSSSTTIPMYDENISSSSTNETDTEGATRVISEEDIKKEIVFQEESGEKKLLVQEVVSAKIEGAIITATGAGNAQIRTNIIQAVEAVTGLATHKIRVFEEGI